MRKKKRRKRGDYFQRQKKNETAAKCRPRRGGGRGERKTTWFSLGRPQVRQRAVARALSCSFLAKWAAMVFLKSSSSSRRSLARSSAEVALEVRAASSARRDLKNACEMREAGKREGERER